MIAALDETLPYDATFQAVTLQPTNNPSSAKLSIDRLLITTGRYHTIQPALTFD